MDAQELRNLQEAYMEIVENQQLDEGKSRRKIAQMYGQSDMKMDYDERNLRNRGDLSKRDAGSIARSRLKGQLSAVGRLRGTSPHVDGSRVNNEEVDIYDVILSHLLDEGYAETPEAAEAIMVNMSEEWRQSIVEEVISEGEKPFPHEKVKAKQVALRTSKDPKALDRRMTMGMAVRRAKEAEKTGGSQRDAGKGWYHGK